MKFNQDIQNTDKYIDEHLHVSFSEHKSFIIISLWYPFYSPDLQECLQAMSILAWHSNKLHQSLILCMNIAKNSLPEQKNKYGPPNA